MSTQSPDGDTKPLPSWFDFCALVASLLHSAGAIYIALTPSLALWPAYLLLGASVLWLVAATPGIFRKS